MFGVFFFLKTENQNNLYPKTREKKKNILFDNFSKQEGEERGKGKREKGNKKDILKNQKI